MNTLIGEKPMHPSSLGREHIGVFSGLPDFFLRFRERWPRVLAGDLRAGFVGWDVSGGVGWRVEFGRFLEDVGFGDGWRGGGMTAERESERGEAAREEKARD